MTLVFVPGATAEIALEAEPDQQFYREGADNEVFVHARVRVGAPAIGDATAGRTGPARRNIVFVLDRSGSMDGERMQALQAGLGTTLQALAADDIVSVVLFGSEVETLIEAQPCAQVRALLEQTRPISAEGGAALYDGLSQGAAQMRRHAASDAVNRLVLVTDGPATKGPREREDFVRLVDTLARDGISVSTIGLGEEFDEDLLAILARTGGGRFQFAPTPAQLEGALLQETRVVGPVVARDAVLTIEYRPICDAVTARGTRAATLDKTRVTVRFPQLIAGDDVDALASAKIEAYRTLGVQRDLARVRLTWTDPVSGDAGELTQTVTVRFSREARDVNESFNVRVYRAAVSGFISDGLADAIAQIDKADTRRALREVRRARDRARDANFYADDPEIDAMVARLDAYIAEVQARGMAALDRKILRSGLFSQFGTPFPESAAKGAP